jgi:hypothetical protein
MVATSGLPLTLVHEVLSTKGVLSAAGHMHGLYASLKAYIALNTLQRNRIYNGQVGKPEAEA